MLYEYRQWVVSTKGWLDLKLPEAYIEQLNQLAQQGWQVDQSLARLVCGACPRPALASNT